MVRFWSGNRSDMTFQYNNRDADILYINICEPYPEQESEELDDEIIPN